MLETIRKQYLFMSSNCHMGNKAISSYIMTNKPFYSGELLVAIGSQL